MLDCPFKMNVETSPKTRAGTSLKTRVGTSLKMNVETSPKTRAGTSPKTRVGTRVGHHILLRSERIVLLRSFKEHNILLLTFLKFLATYETLKNNAFICVLFLRT